MKPHSFSYVRPSSVEEAVMALVEAEGDGKIIAGGQSLVPMMNFRLVSPAVLIDINHIAELKKIEVLPEGGLRIGALTRHHTLETSPEVRQYFPVLQQAMTHVAHLAIRNRGTIGGSITHADPAAELPMMMCLLDAQIFLATPEGPRILEASDFFLGPLTSAVEENELVTEIYLPALPQGAGWAFEEFARRAGDFALAAVGVVMAVAEGRVTVLRIGVMGVGDTPMRMTQAESLLTGQVLTDTEIASAVSTIREAVEPPSDLHASSAYRQHLVGVLAQRALQHAWQRATGAHHD